MYATELMVGILSDQELNVRSELVLNSVNQRVYRPPFDANI